MVRTRPECSKVLCRLAEAPIAPAGRGGATFGGGATIIADMREILLRSGRSGRSTSGVAAAAALLLCVPAPEARAATGAPSLGLPLDCVPGETCWIAKFVDLDPGPGVRDYACQGRANDKHSGTDIALRDLRAMEEGVAVAAAAPGTVLRVRDGVPDVNVRDADPEKIKMGECGNGVVVAHGGEWETQYCHMRQGSIAVKPGQKVTAGQKLGLVGMSGSSEYPHLHLTVRKGNTVVDPFVGTGPRADGTNCGPGKSPLWNAAALEALAYTPASIYNAGFAGAPPSEEEIRSGRLRDTEIDARAPAFILWSELYGIEAGDKLHMRLTGPDGAVMVESTIPLEARKARWFQYIGKKRRAAEWPAGAYRGEITLMRVANGAMQSVTRAVEGRVAGLAPASSPATPASSAAMPAGTAPASSAAAPSATAPEEPLPEMPAPRAGPLAPPSWIPSDETFIRAFVGTIVGFLVLIAAVIAVRIWRHR